MTKASRHDIASYLVLIIGILAAISTLHDRPARIARLERKQETAAALEHIARQTLRERAALNLYEELPPYSLPDIHRMAAENDIPADAIEIHSTGSEPLLDEWSREEVLVHLDRVDLALAIHFFNQIMLQRPPWAITAIEIIPDETPGVASIRSEWVGIQR